MNRKPYRKAPPPRPPRHFIREWRIHRGMTQEELAGEVGLSGGNISMIETGKQGYTQATLELLAGALKTDPASLLARDPADPDGIWTVWDRIPDNERGRAIGVLGAFATPAPEQSPGLAPARRRAGGKGGP